MFLSTQYIFNIYFEEICFGRNPSYSVPILLRLETATGFQSYF